MNYTAQQDLSLPSPQMCLYDCMQYPYVHRCWHYDILLPYWHICYTSYILYSISIGYITALLCTTKFCKACTGKNWQVWQKLPPITTWPCKEVLLGTLKYYKEVLPGTFKYWKEVFPCRALLAITHMQWKLVLSLASLWLALQRSSFKNWKQWKEENS